MAFVNKRPGTGPATGRRRGPRTAPWHGRVAVLLWLALLPAVAPADPYRLTAWPAGAPSPDFTLRDGSGRVVSLASYQGTVLAVYFGFAHCPDACPAMLGKLKVARARLGRDAARTRVLFISLDPGRDSPAVLADYARAFGPGVIALSGSPAEIDRAAHDFFVQYAHVPEGEGYTIDHSTGVFLLDAAGRLRLVGTAGASVDDLAHDLHQLLSD